MCRSAITITTISALVLTACVSNKKFNKMKEEALQNYNALYTTNRNIEASLKACNEKNNELSQNNTRLEEQVTALNDHIKNLKQNNTTMLKQLEGLSVLTSTQAASIKESLENIGAKDVYIQDL